MPGGFFSRHSVRWGAGLIALALAAAGFFPWSFSAAALRHHIGAQIAQETGLTLTSSGRVTFALLPTPRIKIENIGLRGGSLSLDAQVLRGNLRLLPMIGGRVELVSAVFFTPTISATLDAAGLLALQARPGAPGGRRLNSISLVGGLARLRLPGGAGETLISDLDMSAEGLAAGAATRLAGTATWRGGPASFRASLDDAAALIGGQTSGMSFNLASKDLTLALGGRVSASPRGTFEGRLAASGPSLRTVLGAFGTRLTGQSGFNAFSLEGDAAIGARGAAVSNARLVLDTNLYEGALAWSAPAVGARSSVPLLSATLAADVLSLDPVFDSAPGWRGDDGQWNSDIFEPGALAGASLDLRLSAARLAWRGLSFQDAALSIMQQNGRLEVNLIDARAYGGKVKGRIEAAMGETLGVKVVLAFSQLDAGAFSQAVSGDRRVTGTAAGQASLESAGRSPAQLVTHLSGDTQIDLVQGDIAGIDAEQALRRLERKPQTVTPGMIGGRTAFDTAGAGIHLENGLASIPNGELSGPGAHASLQGSFSWPDLLLFFKIALTPPGAPGQARDRPELLIGVIGPWDRPEVQILGPAAAQ